MPSFSAFVTCSSIFTPSATESPHTYESRGRIELVEIDDVDYRQRAHGCEFRGESGKLSDDKVRPCNVCPASGWLRCRLSCRVPQRHLLASVRLQLPYIPACARQGRNVQRVTCLRNDQLDMWTIKDMAPLCRSVRCSISQAVFVY